MKLNELGWSHFFQQQILPEESGLTPARVRRQDINAYHLFSEEGELTGTIPGRFRQQAFSKADIPTVGDWVLVSNISGGEAGAVQIERLLDRKSKFSRKEAGEVIDEQVVASNIDTVFIVSGLDGDHNPNRIERYLLLSWTSGALPVLVLNKADLCDDIDRKLEDLNAIAQGSPIHVLSALDGVGLEQLSPYLAPGTTCAFLGSSGVGKSTIINSLIGYDRFETGAVREEDGRGRHTTTFREMAVSPNGALIIDTPGMRELQVWADSASISLSFDDIETFALNCKFRDCKHQTEPGCAITNAIETGELARERLDRYFKLVREMEHIEVQQNAGARAEKKQSRKKFAKLIKNRSDKRG
jgi:ribosome biogenesis GTPase